MHGLFIWWVETWNERNSMKFSSAIFREVRIHIVIICPKGYLPNFNHWRSTKWISSEIDNVLTTEDYTIMHHWKTRHTLKPASLDADKHLGMPKKERNRNSKKKRECTKWNEMKKKKLSQI